MSKRVGGERRDVTDRAWGKGFDVERRDVTDRARAKGCVSVRRDVTVNARGKGSCGRDVKLHTVQGERDRSGET